MDDVLVHIKEGGQIINWKKLEHNLSLLKPGAYLVKAEKTNKRTIPQNRYYFGLVVQIMKKAFYDLGHELTSDETHEFLKAKFNSKELINEDTGEVIGVPQSTTRLSKEGFGEYIEKIQRFAAQFLGVVIPDPGEQIKIYDDD